MTHQDRPQSPWLEEFRKASGSSGASVPPTGRGDARRRSGVIARVFGKWRMALFGPKAPK
jgi:hypothetical protein